MNYHFIPNYLPLFPPLAFIIDPNDIFTGSNWAAYGMLGGKPMSNSLLPGADGVDTLEPKLTHLYGLLSAACVSV